MSKITLTDLANLQNENTAVNAINSNNQTLETASDNTLSRDGTSPNTMGAALDMNSHQIINLPNPTSALSPLRLQDLTDFIGTGVVHAIPAGGTTGQSLTKISNTDYDAGWSSVSNNFFYPETFGAVGNGVNNDAPAIRSAVAAAKAAGGGTVRLSDKTYLMSSFGASSVFISATSNVSIVGNGPKSILKVANGMNTGIQQFYVIMPETSSGTPYSNVLFKDFAIEFNGANNGGFNYNNVGIGCYAGRNIRIDGVQFLNNPGSQNISFGTTVPGTTPLSDVDIINTYHYNCGDVNNASCLDHSSAYCYAANYTISNNIFVLPSQSSKSTCIEAGGQDGTVVNNAGTFYSRGTNIPAVNMNVSNINFSNNTFVNLNHAVVLWSIAPYALRNINVSNNVFHQSTALASSVAFIDASVDVALTSDGIKISGNILSSDTAAAGVLTDPAILIGKGRIVIENNTIQGFSGPAISNGTLDTNTYITIKGNRIIDCGKTSTAGSKRAVLINSAVAIKEFLLSENFASNDSTAYMTTAFDITLSTASSGSVGQNNFVQNIVTLSALTLSGGFVSNSSAGIMYVTNKVSPPGSTAQMTDGQLLIGDTSGAPVPQTVTGNASITKAGVVTVSSIGGATFAAPGTIGSGTPNTGAFTTIKGTTASATALATGPNGTTNPVLLVDNSTASQAAGVSITGAATGGSPTIQAIDSGANTNLVIGSKGTGFLQLKSGAFTGFFISNTAVSTGLPLLTSALGGIGYGPAGNGVGAAVTQITSRTTGVTINTPTGAITLFSAAAIAYGAGQSFTVTNSSVVATDTIIVNVKSANAANKYIVAVTAVAAGSFEITFFSTGGTTVDSPVFNYAVLKGQTT